MTNEKQKGKFDGLKSFLTCPLFSKKKADELREVHSETEKINDRVQTVESSVKQLEKSLKDSIKGLLKEQKALSKKNQRDADDRKKEIDDSLEDFKEVVVAQTDQVELFQKTASSKVDNAIETVTGVKGDIAGIRTHLMNSNETLQRFQAGYDYQILKNFIKPVARTINDLDQLLERLSGNEKEEVMDARDDLLKLLDDNGVEQIELDLEIPYAEQKKYAEVVDEKERTDDPQKSGLIAAVERVGYKYEFNDGQERVIQPALVKLYE